MTATGDVEEETPKKLYARDLVALNDADLDSFLAGLRAEGGGTAIIAVEDPENFPESFIERLRLRTGDGPSQAAQTLNLDEVNARLLSTAGPRSPLRRVPSCCSTVAPSPPEADETRCYHELVRLGGRPLYPIDLMPDVSSNAASYRHLLRPWCPSAESQFPAWSSVFRTQLLQWEGFRWWQLRSRRRDGLPPDLKIYDWDRWRDLNDVYCIFAADFRPGSETYPVAACKLLAHYGFDRPVQFHSDPRQQDKLTEWLEYLVFEYAEHYRYAWRMAFRQPQHDEAWERVVSSGLLRPFETREYVCDSKSGFIYHDEKNQLERAVRQAESALNAAQEDPSTRSSTAPGARLTVEEATSKLNEAKDALELFARRRGLIAEFLRGSRVFFETRDRIRERDYVVEWVLGEVLAVEAEARKSGGACGAGTDAAARDTPTADAAHDTPTADAAHDTPTADAAHGTPAADDDGIDGAAATSSSRKRTHKSGGAAPGQGGPPPKRRKAGAREEPNPAAAEVPSADTTGRQTRSRQKQTLPKGDGVALPFRRSTRAKAGGAGVVGDSLPLG